MKISYDDAKRRWTLENRGLDFEDAPEVLTGFHIVLEDDRKPYSEARMQTYGHLNGRLIMFAWEPDARRDADLLDEKVQ
jgi:hypothetical protein